MDPFSFAVMAVAQIGIGFLFPSEGPRLKDLKISASTYGAVIPEAFGTVRVAGNMIWSDKIREHKKKKTVGLKRVKYYTYTATFAMACCQGPVQQIRKVWANHKLIYDATGTGKLATKKNYKIRQFLGTEEQLPSEAMEKLVGEGNTPAFRGLCYLMFEDMELDDFGNSIPQISVEVFAAGEGQDAAVYRPFTANPGGAYVSSFDAQGDWGYLIGLTISDGVRRWGLSTLREEVRENVFTKNSDFLLGISPSSGYPIMHGQFANSSPIYLHDPLSFNIIASMGENSSSLQTSPIGQRRADFAIDADGNEYMLYVAVLAYWVTLQTYPIDAFQGQDSLIVGETTNGIYGTTYVTGTQGLKTALFYAWTGSDSSGGGVDTLTCHRITMSEGVPTREIIFSLLNPKPIPTTGDFSVMGIHWDARDGNVILIWQESNRDKVAKLNVTTGEIVWKKDIGVNTLIDYAQSASLEDGELWWLGNTGSGAKVFLMDTDTGDWIRTIADPYADYEDVDDIPASVIAQQGAPYDGVQIYNEDGSNASIYTGIGTQIFDSIRRKIYLSDGVVEVGVGPRGAVTLGGLLRRLFLRAGMKPSQFDVSALEAQAIRGYGWASASDLKSIIDQLRMLYLFDVVERSGRLVGVMRETGTNEETGRQGQPVRRITQKLLGSSGDGQGMEYWNESRLQEADIPARVTLSYMNFDRDMETSTAVSQRISDPVPTMFSRQQVALEMGVVMTGTEAKNQVNKILWSQWSERTRHQTRLPWTFLDLDPSDIVRVAMDDGRVYRERLHATEFGADLGIQVDTYSQDPESYVSDAIGDGGAPSIFPPYNPPRAARPLVFNTPLLRDQDDTSGSYSLYYSGIGHGSGEDFTGGTMWRGETDLQYGVLYDTNTDAEWASVSGILPPAPHGSHALDWETRLVLWPAINWFEIESITDDELWAGANLCIIGDEVIQFRDCVENPDGSWTIWNILRGRRGTEYATDTHKPGELFTFLAADRIEADGDTLDATGKKRFFRAVGDGMPLERAAPLQIEYAPRDLMPYAPKDIRRAKAGQQVTLDWKRRTRMGGNMVDGTDAVPLHETDERYEVYILRNPYVGDLSRPDRVPLDDILVQFETTASTVSFNMGALGSKIITQVPLLTAPYDVDVDTIHVLIYQLSSAVGRGFPGVRSIEPWQDF